MSKVICDVCGTSYPDTANQCPICGCARADVADPVPQNVTEDTAASGTYTYVKGGRFSKANVRKRNMERQLPQEQPQLEVQEEPEKKDKSGKGLVIAAIALLLAIIGVVIYIAIRFLSPAPAPNTDQTGTATTEASTAATTDTTELIIPCTDLTLSGNVIDFDKVGAAELLDVTPTPADTTDVILYVSEDEAVATVSASGKVTAVGPGQTVIVVTCGDKKAECRVVCSIETEPTEETTQPTEAQISEFKLNREDFSLFAEGESWNLYNGDVSQDEITWSSADENVATVEKGVVKAVAYGDTTITAEYQGKKYECVVRCRFAPKETEPSQPTEDGDTNTNTTYEISATDVMLSVGESFTITLKDGDGNIVPVSWNTLDSSICTVSGNTVTGVSRSLTGTKVSTFYDGVAFECIVRVK